MACSCTARSTDQYIWSDGQGNTVVYKTLIEAKAKVLRKGGSFVKQTTTA